MNRRHFVFTILLALILGGCTTISAASPPEEVTFDISMVEIKGDTDDFPPPDVNPRDLSEGYRYTAPGDFDPESPEAWSVGSYQFSPAAMTVKQGDRVTLRMFGVNGNQHIVSIEGPDGSMVVETTIMLRGHEHIVEFEASQAGYYTMRCSNHAPTMNAVIVSVPVQ